MVFVFALGFALAVLIAGDWDGDNFLIAFIVGLSLGLTLTRLLDQRIRRIASQAAPEPPRQEHVQAALEDIHWRLKRLEQAQGLGASPMEAGAGASAPATPLELDPWLQGGHAGGQQVAAASAMAPAGTAAAPADAAVAATGGRPAGAKQGDAGAAASPADSASRSHPATPPPPGGIELLVARFRHWLLGGNTVVRVGIVVLFFGVAFLLKFAVERAVLPLELRLAGVGAGAIALLAIGWRLRMRREAYALALQGAGVGLLYLTLFGAFRLYHLVPPLLALAAMVAVSGFSALLALLQNSRALMSIGVTGGFLAPILASTGTGSHVVLFSYYAVLNLGIFVVAWFKAWRPLNLLGFFFTFSIGLVWGARVWRPEMFASTEPFLILFYAMFLAISVLFAERQGESIGDWIVELAEGRLPKRNAARRVVDSTLVFGLPLVAFGFQAALTRHMEFALAYSALVLAALYLGLARWLQRRAVTQLQLLTESFLALGVIFATLAIPLALDARWTSASWSLEGAALVWVGIHQRRSAAQAFGLFLQFAAALAWWIQPGSWQSAEVPVLNTFCLGAGLIALAALFSAWQLQTRVTERAAWRTAGAQLVFAWGLAWWLGGGLGEAHRLMGDAAFHSFAAFFLAASAAALALLETRLTWPQAGMPAAALLPALAWVFLKSLWEGHHVLGHGGWLAWPAALALHFTLLRRHDADARFPDWSPRVHALGLWLLAAIGSHELHWLAQDQALAAGWQAAALVVLPGALLLGLCREEWLQRWPLQSRMPAYLGWGAFPLLAGFALWLLLTDFGNSADPWPLPWLPLLNPVDLAHVFLGLVALRWTQVLQRHGMQAGVTPDLRSWSIALGILAFIWLNAMLLRTLHHWLHVPYTLHDLAASPLVQAALSLFWTLLALVLMATGTRRVLRALWMAGAGLMAVVVLKLFLVDLERVGSVARIVSFLGVGLLMLLIGYLAPVPPKARDSATETGNLES
jgi:uncharacterized membrane protein